MRPYRLKALTRSALICSLVSLCSLSANFSENIASATPSASDATDLGFLSGALDYQGARYQSRSYRRRSYRRRVVRRRTHRGSNSSSFRNGFLTDIVLEVGGSLFSPMQGQLLSGLQIAGGTRFGPIAGLVEMQLHQGELDARVSDLNAQLRVYLPLGVNTEIYPLLAVGESELFSAQSATHLDLGLGAQFNLSPHFAIGARYSARLLSESVDGRPTNGHNLAAQVSFRF
jgi:hypothetical protein